AKAFSGILKGKHSASIFADVADRFRPSKRNAAIRGPNLMSLCGGGAAVGIGEHHLAVLFGHGESWAAVRDLPGLFGGKQVLVDAQHRDRQNNNQRRGNKERIQVLDVHGSDWGNFEMETP